MAHSKRNTSLPHFTSYERSLLRSTWGSQSTRLSRESFLPFSSCRLCLLPAREPVVACATNGDLFCRECAVNDLLAQRKEIKRLEKEREIAKQERDEDQDRLAAEARDRELKEFEMVSMGLEEKKMKRKRELEENGGGRDKAERNGDASIESMELKKRRKEGFELDEEGMRKIAMEEREKMMKRIEKEKVYVVCTFVHFECTDGILGGIIEISTSIILGTIINTFRCREWRGCQTGKTQPDMSGVNT